METGKKVPLLNNTFSFKKKYKSFVSLPGTKPWKCCRFEANTKFFFILFLSRKSMNSTRRAGRMSRRAASGAGVDETRSIAF